MQTLNSIMRTSNILKGLFFLALVGIVASCSDDKILDDPGFAGQGQAVIVKSGNIAANETWVNTNTYQLSGFVRVQDGVTLTIQAGTIVKGLPGVVPGTLIIERGAKINAQGTSASPIIFTSNAAAGSRASGDWGGVVILGKAYANIRAGVKGAPADFKGAIEGFPATETPGFYGTSVAENGGGAVSPATNELDNSGTLRYVRIEYAGSVISEGNEINGLTLGGVGRGTTIDHVVVAYGSDDGIEWFGGTVRMKYILTFGNEDDDFDNDQGNLTKLQFAIAQKNPEIHVNGSNGARGVESNGDDGDAVASAVNLTTNATFSNITLIGPQGPSCNAVSTDFDNGLAIRDLSRLDIFNSLIAGYPEEQYFLNAPATFGGRATAKNNRWVKINPAPGSNVGASFVAAKWSNDVVGVTNCVAPFINTQAGLPSSAWSYPTVGGSYPSFIPVTGAAVLAGASFTDPVLAGGGFNVVTFRGAVNASGSTGPGSPTDWSFGTNWHDLTPQDNAY